MKNQHFVANVAINILLSLMLLIVAFVGIGDNVITTAVENKAIYHGNENNPNVSLMFNVYWGTECIEPILEILEKERVCTTFFIGGSWAINNNGLLKRICEKGHEIGSHGYSHKECDKISYEKNLEEIKMADATIKGIVGVETYLFAPPSGAISSDMFRACEQQNKKVIMWSRDTIDWRDKDSELVLKRATLDIQNGDLVLMHPTEHTLKALPKIIQNLKRQGFNLTTVSRCLEPTAM